MRKLASFMEGYVYILKSIKNNSYYLGSTSDISRRLMEHNQGKTTYTKNLMPWKLVFYKKYDTLVQARQVEYKLKRSKSKKLLEQIIIDKDINMGR
jgi:putative endonuclease